MLSPVSPSATGKTFRSFTSWRRRSPAPRAQRRRPSGSGPGSRRAREGFYTRTGRVSRAGGDAGSGGLEDLAGLEAARADVLAPGSAARRRCGPSAGSGRSGAWWRPSSGCGCGRTRGPFCTSNRPWTRRGQASRKTRGRLERLDRPVAVHVEVRHGPQTPVRACRDSSTPRSAIRSTKAVRRGEDHDVGLGWRSPRAQLGQARRPARARSRGPRPDARRGGRARTGSRPPRCPTGGTRRPSSASSARPRRSARASPPAPRPPARRGPW